MSAISDRINSEEFGSLSVEDKYSESKELFKQFVGQSPELQQQLSSLDKDGRQGMLQQFRGKLFDKFPDNFSKTRKVKKTRDVPTGEISIGVGGPVAMQHKRSETVIEDVRVPLLDPKTERFIDALESGRFKPKDVFDGKNLKDLDDKDIDSFVGIMNSINALASKDQPHISPDRRKEFQDLGNSIIEAKGGRSAPQTGTLAAGAEFLLGIPSAGVKAAGSVGQRATNLVNPLIGREKKSPEELDADIARLHEENQGFTPLERSVRGDLIETAETGGAIAGSLLGGLGLSNALSRLSISAAKKLGLTALGEGVIGFATEDKLGSFTVDFFGEKIGVEKGSAAAKALGTLEGALLGTLGALMPKAARDEIFRGIKDVAGELNGIKASVITDEIIDLDAAIMKKRFPELAALPDEEVREAVKKIYGTGFEPIARRDEAIALEKKGLSPSEQPTRLNPEQIIEQKRAANEADKFKGIDEQIEVLEGEEAGRVGLANKLAREEDLADQPIVRSEDEITEAFEEATPLTVEAEARAVKLEQLAEDLEQPIPLREDAELTGTPTIEQRAQAFENKTPAMIEAEARLLKAEQLADDLGQPIPLRADEVELRATNAQREEAFNEFTPSMVEAERVAAKRADVEEALKADDVGAEGRAAADASFQEQATGLPKLEAALNKSFDEGFQKGKSGRGIKPRANGTNIMDEKIKGFEEGKAIGDAKRKAVTKLKPFREKLSKGADITDVEKFPNKILHELADNADPKRDLSSRLRDEITRRKEANIGLTGLPLRTLSAEARVGETGIRNARQVDLQTLADPRNKDHHLHKQASGEIERKLHEDPSEGIVQQMKANSIFISTAADASKRNLGMVGEIENINQKGLLKKGGMSLDQAAEQLRQLGFDADTPDDVLNLLDDASRGVHVSPTKASGLSAEAERILDANDRIVNRLSKQLVDNQPGKDIGGVISTKMMSDLTIVGADLLKRGFTKFADFSKEMISRFGESIRGTMSDIWEHSRDLFNNPKKKVIDVGRGIDETFGITKEINENLSKKFARNKFVKAIDGFTSPVMTRISRLNKKIGGRVDLFEFDITKKVGDSLKRVDKFVSGMDRLRKVRRELYREVDRAFMNSNIQGAKDLITGSDMDEALKTQLLTGIDETQAELKSMFEQAQEAGLDIGHIEDYMPRTVKDHKGFLKSIGQVEKDALEQVWANEKKRIGRNLNEAEKAELANRFLLREGSGGSSKLSFQKQRKVDEVSQANQQFYGETHQNLIQYIGQMQDRIAKQKLFGRQAASGVGDIKVRKTITGEDGKKESIIVNKGEKIKQVQLEDGSIIKQVTGSPDQLIEYNDKSLGDWITEAAPDMVKADREEMIELLKARFVQGEGSVNSLNQAVKNVGYIATMGRFTNAITQLGDMWASIRTSPMEFVPAVSRRILRSDEAANTVQLGINKINEEVAANPQWTSKVLNKLFATTGLKQMDKFGKDVFLDSAYLKFQKQAKGLKGDKALAKLRKTNADRFGDEFADKLIEDLKDGVRSYEVDAVLFKELTGIQPISKSEMPEFYLKHPNARIFFMLKSFTLKQIDQIRREGVDELLDAIGESGKGKRKEAGKKAAGALTKIGMIAAGTATFEASTSDVIKDALRGKEISVDSVSDAAFANFQRLFFMNKYITQKVGNSGDGFWKKWMDNVIQIPVLSIPDEIGQDINSWFQDDLSIGTARNTFKIPYIGDLLWWNSDAGQKRKKKIQDDNERGESPLFMNIEDVKKDAKKTKKAFNEEVDADLNALSELDSQQEKARYFNRIKGEDPERAKAVFRRFKAGEIVRNRGLSVPEQSFKNLSVDVKANQMAEMINAMESPQEKAEFYNDMKRKGILTKSVAKKLNPQIGINR